MIFLSFVMRRCCARCLRTFLKLYDFFPATGRAIFPGRDIFLSDHMGEQGTEGGVDL